MAFYVGQKVARFRFGKPDNRAPNDRLAHIAIGEVVTIREIVNVKRRDGKYAVGLRFDEYIGPTRYYASVGPFELDYAAENFRPVVERKTDISIFKAMLNPKTAEIDA